jgi:hypothetical protein
MRKKLLLGVAFILAINVAVIAIAHNAKSKNENQNTEAGCCASASTAKHCDAGNSVTPCAASAAVTPCAGSGEAKIIHASLETTPCAAAHAATPCVASAAITPCAGSGEARTCCKAGLIHASNEAPACSGCTKHAGVECAGQAGKDCCQTEQLIVEKKVDSKLRR